MTDAKIVCPYCRAIYDDVYGDHTHDEHSDTLICKICDNKFRLKVRHYVDYTTYKEESE